MHRWRGALLIVLIIGQSLIATGCWDVKSVQDVNYFTGMGIDYVNDRYVVYIQQLDFASIAKSNGGPKSDKPAESWIGRASGRSVAEALQEIYRTSQQTVFWGHLSTILISERLLRQRSFREVFDALTRSPDIRFTPWIFGTRDDLEETFTTLAFFNLSPLNTILYAPEKAYRQNSVIQPIRLFQMTRGLVEPGQTVLLPSLHIAKDTWSVNKKPDEKLEIDGVFAVHENDYEGWFSEIDNPGLQWMNPRASSLRLMLNRGNKPLATLKIIKPKIKIVVRSSGGEPEFAVRIRINSQLIELWETLTLEEIEKLAVAQIRKDVENTFEKAVKRDTDIFNLSHQLYWHKFRVWKALTDNGKTEYIPREIARLDVDVKVLQTGMYQSFRTFTP